MPAHNVSLEQAKDWAKRLQKADPALSKLSHAQKVVAIMLGHADWHGLTRHYTRDRSDNGRSLDRQLDALNRLYPGLEATSIEVLAMEQEEIEGTVDDIIDRAHEIEREDGCFLSEAMEQAMREAVVLSKPPPGHLFVRVLRKDGSRVGALLPNDA